MKDADCRPSRRSKRDYSKHAQLFKALGDPQRLRIFATIATADDDVCVCDLTSELPLLQPTVSHHLRVLKEAGLIVGERRAIWIYYRIAPGATEVFSSVLQAVFPQLELHRTLRKIG